MSSGSSNVSGKSIKFSVSSLILYKFRFEFSSSAVKLQPYAKLTTLSFGHSEYCTFASKMNLVFFRTRFVGLSFTSNRSNSSEASCSTNNSGTSGTSSLSLSSKNRSDNLHNHRKHDNCGSHCLGAIPRNPQYSSQFQKTSPRTPPSDQQMFQQQQQYHTPINSQHKQLYTSKRNTNYYTPKSASYSIFSSDMQNRLPPIKEFRSPTKASIASPSRVASAPRLR